MTTTAFAARDVRVCAKLPRSFPPSKLVVCSNFGKPCVFRGVKLEFFLYISALINIMARTESFEACLIELKFNSEELSKVSLFSLFCFIFLEKFFLFFSRDQLGPFILS